ncbi:helix-turn-helix domain-containing protein [Longibaculum muris]|uniref:helix-turn-helix domain-containing protein n=1 Tax=Longibaculum muris TaxID=1796628 RepID=UPI003AB237DF
MIGKNIRYYIKRENVTQEELAFEIDKYQSRISKIELGEANISIRELNKIAKVIEIIAILFIDKSQNIEDIKAIG